MDDDISRRYTQERETMQRVFASLSVKKTKYSGEFFEMAHNYYNDSYYFFKKGDVTRAFEAIVISWSYIDAGLKLGMFSLPQELHTFFTQG
ncbi:DUF357 domain-containing protein [Candidatus Parvarchaeota archaeon]|nr:DUF357 domain-containing protein [Candidatus Parvarchaeota archaeon]